jgi:hypothetical protein
VIDLEVDRRALANDVHRRRDGGDAMAVMALSGTSVLLVFDAHGRIAAAPLGRGEDAARALRSLFPEPRWVRAEVRHGEIVLARFRHAPPRRSGASWHPEAAADPDPPAREPVDLAHQHDVRSWTRRFGVSERELRRAVREVEEQGRAPDSELVADALESHGARRRVSSG